MLVRVAFLDQRFGRGERQDLIMAVGGGPGRAQRRPAGPVGLVFIAQGGDGRCAPVPEMCRLLEGFGAAGADQGAANTGKELPDRRQGLRRQRVQDVEEGWCLEIAEDWRQ